MHTNKAGNTVDGVRSASKPKPRVNVAAAIDGGMGGTDLTWELEVRYRLFRGRRSEVREGEVEQLPGGSSSRRWTDWPIFHSAGPHAGSQDPLRYSYDVRKSSAISRRTRSGRHGVSSCPAAIQLPRRLGPSRARKPPTSANRRVHARGHQAALNCAARGVAADATTGKRRNKRRLVVCSPEPSLAAIAPYCIHTRRLMVLGRHPTMMLSLPSDGAVLALR